MGSAIGIGNPLANRAVLLGVVFTRSELTSQGEEVYYLERLAFRTAGEANGTASSPVLGIGPPFAGCDPSAGSGPKTPGVFPGNPRYAFYGTSQQTLTLQGQRFANKSAMDAAIADSRSNPLYWCEFNQPSRVLINNVQIEGPGQVQTFMEARFNATAPIERNGTNVGSDADRPIWVNRMGVVYVSVEVDKDGPNHEKFRPQVERSAITLRNVRTPSGNLAGGDCET